MSPTAIRATVVSAGLLVGAAPALAQLHDVDIILRAGDGRMQTGAVVNQQAVFPQRIFVATFGAFDFTNDPGYDSDPAASGLAPGTTVGYDFLSALHVWNGTDFHAVASPVVRVTFGPLNATTPTTDQTAPGFGVSISAGGTYHHHFGYTLLSTATPPLVPAETGVYLLELQVWSSSPTVARSLPYWMIFNQNAEPADLAAAEAWSRSHLLCLADVAGLGGSIGGDGQLTADDIVLFLGAFFGGDLSVADVAGLGGSIGGDGQLSADDIVVFLSAFFAGCG
ncbi:MAG: GC-type dockerin domain-anchored protein [Phycisphaerales bacterium]